MPIELGVAVATSAGVFGWSVWGAQIRFWFANLVISRPKAYPRRVECASRVSPQGYPQGTAGEARARARSTRTEKAERASSRAHFAQRRKSPISSWRWRSVSPATVFDGAIRQWLSERAALAGPTV